MDQKDLVSIIVPVYKVEKYLDQCVQSLVDQTYQNIEIVLVDDGSPDSCPAMCDEWSKKDSRIKVIHKQNGGLMSAWVEGVKNCTADYVCFVDSDDYVKEGFVEILYGELMKNNADVSICDYVEVWDDGKEIVRGQFKETKLFIKNKDYNNLAEMLRSFSPCRWNKIFRKKLVVECLDYLNQNIRIGEDLNATFYILGMSNKVSYTNTLLYCYRQQNQSMMHESKDNFDNYQILVDQLIFINNKKGFGLENLIADKFCSNFLLLSLLFYINKKNSNALKKVFESKICEFYLKNSQRRNSIKEKILYWSVKHKKIWLLKWIYKLKHIKNNKG